MEEGSKLARSDDYGVLTPRRLVRWIGALVVVAALVATLLGFVGAAHGVSVHHFSWSLAAVAGTAVGTVLLAGFTGALAWTTSGDVRATIRLADTTQEEQRARDRPIIAVRPVQIRNVVLDPATRETLPVLDLWLKNVGLGPALDLHLRATYNGTAVPTEEVIAVVEVGQVIDSRPISLAGVEEPDGTGFALEAFAVSGKCTDRTRAEEHPIVILAEAGLQDQLLAAQANAALRAWLRLTGGLHEGARGQEVRYQSQVHNLGPADAEDVRVQLVDSTGNDVGEQFIVGHMAARGQTDVPVVCPFPHETMSGRLTWRDGRGAQSLLVEDAYPALPSPIPKRG